MAHFVCRVKRLEGCRLLPGIPGISLARDLGLRQLLLELVDSATGDHVTATVGAGAGVFRIGVGEEDVAGGAGRAELVASNDGHRVS